MHCPYHAFLVPIFQSRSKRAEMPLSNKEKKRVRRRASYWVMPKSNPSQFLIWYHLRKGKTGQGHGDYLLFCSWMHSYTVLLRIWKIYSGVFLSWMFSCFLKIWALIVRSMEFYRLIIYHTKDHLSLILYVF